MKLGLPFVVDTNVLLVANEQHPGVSPECVIACIEALENLRLRGVVVIDDQYEILSEYRQRTSPNTGNRVGDAFLKWLYQNSGNPDRVECVRIEQHSRRGYVGFPEDEDLDNFDRADRKFVAVASVHSDRPLILQAADSRWTQWAGSLAKHGISVQFLCPEDIARFALRRERRAAKGY